ncbi:MAG: TonB C-terminal domain-containing protein [bacterium]|nr:TonB C-terminal domain-containing protein [bacterium]
MRFINLLLILGVIFISSTFVEAYEQPYDSPVRSSYGSGNREFADYMANIKSSLSRNWYPPDFMEGCHIRVLFKLNPQGRIISKEIIESSGNDVYDDSALDALLKSEPFGNFPENSDRQWLTINYVFDTVLLDDEKMKGYFSLAKRSETSNPAQAIEYYGLAMEALNGHENRYFLYKRRANIKKRIGDNTGAEADYAEYENMKRKVDIKRAHLLKHLTEINGTPYLYFYLAYSYEQIGEISNAINAINKAIEMNSENSRYIRYKNKLQNLR